MEIAVWAPTATKVEAILGEAHSLLQPTSDGWWRLAASVPPGTRYAFSVDDGPALPDPRSQSQPDGVHGPSELVDPAIFEATSSGPGIDLLGQALYELHVGTFTPQGTFDSAIARLDHLVDLGVAAVEIMPVADFPGVRGWGYDGVGLYAVHRTYGGPEAFARFITAAHERGLGVVLDVVPNHLGPEGNYLEAFGPYFTDNHQTPWGPAINLDGPGSDQVRAFLIGAARQWLVDFGVDGLRLDAVHALLDDSPKHFLAELSETVAEWSLEVGRPLTLIAESDENQPSTVCPVGSLPGARGMAAQWADDVHHALHSFLTGEQQGYYVDFGSAEVMQHALTRVFVHEGGYSTFRDQDWGAPVEASSPHYDGHSFVVSLQNHDQVGNRASGDRIGHGQVPGLQAAGAALYLLSPFTPMLFMGEEWAASTPFPYFSDLGPELGPLVSQGRAREFSEMAWAGPVPDPQAPATFASAILRWEELDEPAAARVLAWYRRLLELRRTLPELSSGDLGKVRATVLSPDAVELHRGDISVVAARCGGLDVGPGEVLASWDQLAPGAPLPGPGAVILRRPTS